MSLSSVAEARNHLGLVRRTRPDDHEAICEARSCLAAAKLDRAIRHDRDALTPPHRVQLALLVLGGEL